jgi:hypothetical protein
VATAGRVGRAIGAAAPQLPSKVTMEGQAGGRQQLPGGVLVEPVPERPPVSVTHSPQDRRGFYVFTAGPRGVRIISTAP